MCRVCFNAQPASVQAKTGTEHFGFSKYLGIFTWAVLIWVVATPIFLEFSPRKLGKIPILTHIFQMG